MQPNRQVLAVVRGLHRQTLMLLLTVLLAVHRTTPALCDESLLVDGGFETGEPSAAWIPTGERYEWGAPAGYIVERPDLARTGSFCAILAGYFPEDVRNGFDQAIPPVPKNAVLSFFVRSSGSSYCYYEDEESFPPSNYVCTPSNLVVHIDNILVLTIDGLDQAPQTGYTLYTVPLSNFADGNAHTLRFFAPDYGASFRLDDVCISPGGSGVDAPPAAFDLDADNRVQLGELLRVIQFYTMGGLHCVGEDETSEDGYLPGPGSNACTHYGADYSPVDWKISLGELLRVIQFYNQGGYYACPQSMTEDGWCVPVTID